VFEFTKLAETTGGRIIAQNWVGTIGHFLTDSRKVVNPQASLFIAICGQRHDGHDHIGTLYKQGVRQFMIEHEVRLDHLIIDNCNILLVPNAVLALQKVASHHRQQHDIPVIAITGSNGKTIVKEWLGQLLAETYKIVKSPKSYNSQLGVPLSVLQMNEWHSIAIFEAGISTNGEMQKLQQVIQPTYGIFTNLGSAHDEGFRNRAEKAHEKWLLFSECDRVIYCKDHEPVVASKPEYISGFTWGRGPDADVQIVDIRRQHFRCTMTLRYQQSEFTLKLPFADAVAIENLMHCIVVMLLLEVPKDHIFEQLQHLDSISHRLSVKQGVNRCVLIDDSYNNDLAGLQAALDFLHNQPQKSRRVILSDILQSGIDQKALYMQLNELLVSNQIDSFIGIGPHMMKNQSAFQLGNRQFYASTEEFLRKMEPGQFVDENILIKGARPFEFEKITSFLAEKIHGTLLEINLDALNENLNYYRSKLQRGVKLMVMVKASAYGTGSFEVANLLQYNLVDYLAVAYTDEGVELRRHGIHMPVMVMNVATDSYQKIHEYELEPEIYGFRQLRELIAFMADKQKIIPIHLKFDSGMHRLGFESEQIPELVKVLKEAGNLQVVSVYSHLAGADDARHNDFSHHQHKQFIAMVNQLKAGLSIDPIVHLLNSAGIIRFPEYQLDMVRLGIGLYGFEATASDQHFLRPISTLKTTISQVRTVKKGETVGYGRKGSLTRDSEIATIAIGYADGFLRAFGNGNAKLLVNGKLAPVIGNVCMDMTMLDVTGLKASEGDEVIVFGEQPGVADLADSIGTIPYEILTNISSRVPRVYFSE
jgi:alanine racemase